MIENFSLNIEIFRFFYNWGLSHPHLALFLGDWLLYGIVLMGTFLILWWNKKEWKKNWVLILPILSYLVVKIIKISFPTERPFVFLKEVKALVVENPLSSFPSAHSVVVFSFATLVFWKNKKVGFLLYLLAILVALGRMMLGVHYFLDVLVGAVIGVFLTWRILKLFRQVIGDNAFDF